MSHDEKAVIEETAQDEKIASSVQEAFVIDPVKEKALMRRVDLRLFPMVWLMLLMNYIDRTNIGNAKVGGMAKDLKMTSGDYSLVLSIFYVGYLLFEVPSNMLLTHSSPRLFLPGLMVTWGAMSIGAKGIHSTAGMAVFRFMLGAVEAGFYPGVAFLMSCWYKPDELARRMTIFYSATLVAGAIGGLLAGGIIEGMEQIGGTRGWQWLFIIEGLMTVVVASFAFFILPDYPTNTKWLSEEEKKIAIHRLLAYEPEEMVDGHRVGHWDAFKLACKDPRTWVFLVTYNVIACSGTISYFIPTLMNSLGYYGRSAQFMTVPIYVVSLVLSLTSGYIADKTNQKALTICAAGTLSTVCYVLCATINNYKAKYAILCFGAAGIWTVIPIFLSWITTMFDGREKRAIAIAMINGFGNLSSIYGSFFWPSTHAPRYVIGFGVTCSLCGLLVVLCALAKWRFGDRGVARTS